MHQTDTFVSAVNTTASDFVFRRDEVLVQKYREEPGHPLSAASAAQHNAHPLSVREVSMLLAGRGIFVAIAASRSEILRTLGNDICFLLLLFNTTRAHTPDPQARGPLSLWTEVWPTQPVLTHPYLFSWLACGRRNGIWSEVQVLFISHRTGKNLLRGSSFVDLRSGPDCHFGPRANHVS
jgi:hypothetical protein